MSAAHIFCEIAKDVVLYMVVLRSNGIVPRRANPTPPPPISIRVRVSYERNMQIIYG